VTPTVPRIINSLKSLATKEAGLPLWQRGYYEHIIRGERDYSDIWNYIETNPAKWAEDQYYM
jgi:REP element-mobilizing transposase RayT